MRKYIIVFAILICNLNIAKSQDTLRVKYRITTIPFQYIFNDYSFTFEKLYKNRLTLGLTLGYRPSTQKGGKLEFRTTGMFSDYTYQNYWNRLYNATTVGINSKYYLSRFNAQYIEGYLFYRLWWFDKKDFTYQGQDDDIYWSGIRTEKQQIYGMKLLMGQTLQLKSQQKIRRIIELYYGVGFRYKTCRFETENGTFYNSQFLPYKLEIQKFWTPTFHLGLKVGIGWYK